MLYYILFNSYESPEQAVILFLITICVFAFSLSLHEFSHAFAALKMGDPTAKLAGRMSLNPFRHLTISGFLFFVLFGIGWAKPTPVNCLNFKKYKKGTRWVSSAGVLSNLALGLIAAGLYAILMNTVGVANTAMEYVYILLATTMLVNSFLFMFNILPIYPFDGFTFLSTYLKGNSKFLQNSIRYSSRILISVLMICLVVELLFGIDILDMYLSLLYNFVFLPVACI